MEVMSGFYWDSGKKEINQDSVLVEQVNTGKGRILLAAVSDGIGGLPAGEVASGFLMERLQQHFYEEILPLIRKGKSSKKIRHSFFRCLYETVGMLQKYADSREISLGATLSVLLLMKRRYLILHVGDSRIYEIRKKRIRQLTEDHRGEGNILTRCMGSFPMSEVYVFYAVMDSGAGPQRSCSGKCWIHLRSLQRNRFRSGFLKLEAMERDRGRGTISQRFMYF